MDWFMFQELTQDKSSLQHQVNQQMNELSSLRTQMEELKLNAARHTANQAAESELKELLQRERHCLEEKTKEVSILHCFGFMLNPAEFVLVLIANKSVQHWKYRCSYILELKYPPL